MAIARALVHDPLLVLADEPTGNLDEDTGRDVLELLDRLTRQAGKNLILVTHSPEAAAWPTGCCPCTAGAWSCMRHTPTCRGAEPVTTAPARPPLGVRLRYLRRHPWQTLLMVLGIALGVAVVVAVDLANSAATRAFDLSTDAIAGRATHQIVGGPLGLDEAVYTRLRVDGGVRPAAPVVTDYVSSPQLGDRPLQLLGVDPFAEAPFRSYLLTGAARCRASGVQTSPVARPPQVADPSSPGPVPC